MRDIPFLLDNTLRSYGALIWLLWISYKHLAALRPSQILSANFRNRILATKPKILSSRFIGAGTKEDGESFFRLRSYALTQPSPRGRGQF